MMANGPEAFWEASFAKLGPATAHMRDGFVSAWSQPGAVAAMLAWYRAAPFVLSGDDVRWTTAEDFTVKVPTLVMWGMQDMALLPILLDGLDEFVPDLTVERFPDAGHSLIHQQPEAVAARIRSFLA